MIFIIWYRTKVLHVLKEAFQYKPTMLGWQSEIFNGVTRQIRKQGGNEYDGAVGFMLVMARSLPDPTTPEARAFIARVEVTAATLMPHGKLGRDAFA